MVYGPARYMRGPAGYMLSYGLMVRLDICLVVAHVILVSVQVLLVLTLGLWTFDLTWDLGLTILKGYIDIDLFISFPG